MKKTEWFYSTGKERLGPIDAETLALLLQHGTLTEDSLVWKKGMSGWTPAGAVSELAETLNRGEDEPPPLPALGDPPPLPTIPKRVGTAPLISSKTAVVATGRRGARSPAHPIRRPVLIALAALVVVGIGAVVLRGSKQPVPQTGEGQAALPIDTNQIAQTPTIPGTSIRPTDVAEKPQTTSVQKVLRNLAARVQAEQVDLGNGITMEMVQIPAGEFTMGDIPESLKDSARNFRIPHTVRLTSPFLMSRFEVTQSQYASVTGKNPSFHVGKEFPVERVSWFDAADFCRVLSARFGRNFNLPTEAQWEYACRAGSRTCFHSCDSESDLNRFAWYKGNSDGETHPVGKKEPNAWGLYDMHGNVSEWCRDEGRDFEYYAAVVTDPIRRYVPRTNLAGAPQNFWETRGGSWISAGTECLSAYRKAESPKTTATSVGFRVVINSTADDPKGNFSPYENTITLRPDWPIPIAPIPPRADLSELNAALEKKRYVDAEAILRRNPSLAVSADSSSTEGWAGRTPLERWIYKSQEAALLLLKYGAKPDCIVADTPLERTTLLHQLITSERFAEAQLLLAKGADPNLSSYSRFRVFHPFLTKPPLHIACLEVLIRDTPEKFTLIEGLIKAGARVDGQDNQGCTAIHWTVEAKLNKAHDLYHLYILLSNGANINAKSHDGSTPLHTAVTSSNADAVLFLRANGADPSIRNNQGMTPMELNRSIVNRLTKDLRLPPDSPHLDKFHKVEAALTTPTPKAGLPAFLTKDLMWTRYLTRETPLTVKMRRGDQIDGRYIRVDDESLILLKDGKEIRCEIKNVLEVEDPFAFGTRILYRGSASVAVEPKNASAGNVPTGGDSPATPVQSEKVSPEKPIQPTEKKLAPKPPKPIGPGETTYLDNLEAGTCLAVKTTNGKTTECEFVERNGATLSLKVGERTFPCQLRNVIIIRSGENVIYMAP